MEMTFEQYSSKMFSILETAIYNYEINVLVEDASGEEAEAKKKFDFAKVKAIASKVIKTVWEKLKQFIAWLIKAIDNMTVKSVVVDEDDKIERAAIEFDGKLCRYATEVATGKLDNVDEINAYLEQLKSNKSYVAKGTTVHTSQIQGILKKYYAAIGKIQSSNLLVENTDDISNKISAISKAIVMQINSYVKQCEEVLNLRKAQEMADGREKAAKKEEKRQLKVKPMTDSVDEDAISLSARLILEAVNLLEDAEDNVSGIEGGEGTQDPIDDIPEEKPEEGKEYPAEDVTGGEGEKIDLEEVKELVGDDKEALEILQDGEGSKAITESVIIRF